MQNNAMDENSNSIHSSKERLKQQYYVRKDFKKSREIEYIERNDHSKRDGEMLEEASTQVVL